MKRAALLLLALFIATAVTAICWTATCLPLWLSQGVDCMGF